MDLTLYDEQNRLTQEQIKLVTDILDFAANDTEINLPEDTEISVTFIDNEEIREINKEYRHKDYATDVISFAIEDEVDDEFPINLEGFDIPRNIGDLFVSVEKIQEQAEEYGHSFDRELGFLVLHGFLHLNGYDHMEPADEKEMFDLQRKILDNYGLER
ncbi:rRNA maturation RNase YbeY [Vagococcus silagei]|uniref:Endoribonuclease YbeY n=1 Tax=Vagococcus silagei TaxID=2508885 RepID=A0A4S3B3G2_9ENTE|nr:rRNA maturation RNase YbeY [Vagococcus silagei]THB61674.1 rRNA maturation RNase YbeY [Vagococcus silagei]